MASSVSACEHIRSSRGGAVETITIDRPEKRNALALQTIEELRASVEAAARDHDVRAIVLTGSGDGAFASGADLAEIPDAMDTPENAWAYDRTVSGLYEALMDAQVPIVARMQASAIGGGLLLALACDIRVCAAVGANRNSRYRGSASCFHRLSTGCWCVKRAGLGPSF